MRDNNRDVRKPSSLRPTVSAVDMDAFLRELATVKLRRVSREGLDNSFSSSTGSSSFDSSQSSTNTSSSFIFSGLDRSRLRQVASNSGSDPLGSITVPVEDSTTKLLAVEQSASLPSSWRSRFFAKLRSEQSEPNRRNIVPADGVAKKRKRSFDINPEPLRGTDARARQQSSKKFKPSVAALSQGRSWFVIGKVHAHESFFQRWLIDGRIMMPPTQSCLSLLSMTCPRLHVTIVMHCMKDCLIWRVGIRLQRTRPSRAPMLHLPEFAPSTFPKRMVKRSRCHPKRQWATPLSLRYPRRPTSATDQ